VPQNRWTTPGLHRTYWIAQWPRLDVGPAFLAPVLLSPTAVRSFSVVVEPVPPARARLAIEAAVTSDEADEELRRERGFRTTARRRKQQAATRRREAELAEGHEELRFAGFITVSGRDGDELERTCDEITQSAQQAYLDLQPMWGQQDTGFVCGALRFVTGSHRPASSIDDASSGDPPRPPGDDGDVPGRLPVRRRSRGSEVKASTSDAISTADRSHTTRSRSTSSEPSPTRTCW
jgi:hypothetical protein